MASRFSVPPSKRRGKGVAILSDDGPMLQDIRAAARTADRFGQPYCILVLDPRSHLANQYHAALCNFTQEAGQTVPGLDQGQEIVTLALHQCLLPTTVAMMSVKLVQPLPDIPVLIWHQDDVCVAFSLSQLRGTPGAPACRNLASGLPGRGVRTRPRREME